ncbi:MAG: UDP-N-acetylglucosamine 1-carboxyvinyltransferase [Bacilli bacterium]|nr:UDP-N-acetylglucosamine 1-carboxyvinyltransferase [Bacilli bacterium]
MHRIIIHGGKKLSGEITISGAKNSAVALIPGAILCDETITLSNVPNISDVDSLEEMLLHLNTKIERRKNGVVFISSKDIVNKPINKDLSKKLRASYYFMGALLGRFKHVEMCFPGGCTIGARPIDLHIKGFRALGATVEEDGENFIIDAVKLKGTKIYLDFASVGATINLMFAAVKAEGTTIINNAAKEPEIVNIATYLNNMGAKISGAGTSKIKIKGVKYLHTCFHEVIPDRIEAGTYEIIAAAVGKDMKINNIIPDHLDSLNQKLLEMNVNLKINDDSVEIKESDNIKHCDIVTEIYPGFPTDLQQVLASLMAVGNGESSIKETIWENRFLNLHELAKMGATINIIDDTAYIKGVKELTGTEVNASDLRAGAGLVVAGLLASGTTIINNADFILRGYENIVEKLSKVGADIELEEI